MISPANSLLLQPDSGMIRGSSKDVGPAVLTHPDPRPQPDKEVTAMAHHNTMPSWNGELPPFDFGQYKLSEDGVFYHPYQRGTSKQYSGEKPSRILRSYLRYHQQGACGSCGIPEWATGRVFHVHRLEPKGLYSVYNTTLLCRSCHVSAHGAINRQVRNAG